MASKDSDNPDDSPETGEPFEALDPLESEDELAAVRVEEIHEEPGPELESGVSEVETVPKESAELEELPEGLEELPEELEQELSQLAERLTDLELAARVSELEGEGGGSFKRLAEKVQRNEQLARESVRRLSRQINNVLTENEERFEGIWNQMATLNTWAKDMLKQLFARVQTLEQGSPKETPSAPAAPPAEELEAILELQHTTMELGARLDTLQTGLAELETDKEAEPQASAPGFGLEQLQERVEQLESKEGAAEDAPALTELEARLEKLESREGAPEGSSTVAELEARLEQLESREAAPDEAGARLEALEAHREELREAGLAARLQQLEDAVESRLAACEAAQKEQSAQLEAALDGRLTALEESSLEMLEKLESALASQQEQLQKLEEQQAAFAEQAAIDARLESLEASLADRDALLSKLEQLETQQAQAETDRHAIDSLQAQYAVLAGGLDQQQEDAAQTRGRLEKVIQELAERPDPEAIASRAVQRALEQSGPPVALEELNDEKFAAMRTELFDQVDVQLAARVQLNTEALKRRIAQLEKKTDGGLSPGAPVTASQAFASTGQMAALGYDSKFITLVREVKALRERVRSFPETPAKLLAHPDFARALAAHAPSQDSSEESFELPSLTEILNSAEFKSMFDARIQQVLDYIKSTVVPKAVQHARES